VQIASRDAPAAKGQTMAASSKPMKIIVTRPEPDASRFAALAAAAGYDPIISPVMEIKAAPARIDFSTVGALAFTSANGVRALAALNQPPRPLPVFAVGPVTAAAARQAGHTGVHTAGGDVGSLAVLIKREWTGDDDLVHVAGKSRAGDLVKALEAANIAARRVALYEAIPAPDMSQDAELFLKTAREPGWVALFSPRSAKFFIEQAQRADLTGALAQFHAACLSDAVAKEAARIRWASVSAPTTPTGEALLSMIAEKTGACAAPNG